MSARDKGWRFNPIGIRPAAAEDVQRKVFATGTVDKVQLRPDCRFVCYRRLWSGELNQYSKWLLKNAVDWLARACARAAKKNSKKGGQTLLAAFFSSGASRRGGDEAMRQNRVGVPESIADRDFPVRVRRER